MTPATLDPLKKLRNTILVTDVRSGLAKLPDESIDCVVTSFGRVRPLGHVSAPNG